VHVRFIDFIQQNIALKTGTAENIKSEVFVLEDETPLSGERELINETSWSSS